ncbi:hypothetical protein D3C83_49070 [compost metagenome]
MIPSVWAIGTSGTLASCAIRWTSSIAASRSLFSSASFSSRSRVSRNALPALDASMGTWKPASRSSAGTAGAPARLGK